MNLHRQTLRRRPRGCTPLLGLALAAASATGCRADVDGVWEGSIGRESARLSLDQAGSIVAGEACIASICTEIDEGEIVEEDLSLEFGCPSCGVAATLLDAHVEGSTLSGVAYLEACECTAESCECVVAVELDRSD